NGLARRNALWEKQDGGARGADERPRFRPTLPPLPPGLRWSGPASGPDSGPYSGPDSGPDSGSSLRRALEALRGGVWCQAAWPVISEDQKPMAGARSLSRTAADHELRLLDDRERLKRRQAVDYDSDEEEEAEGRDQNIVLTQDLEDAWEQRLNRFHTQPRVQGDVDACVDRSDRWLTEPLVLLTQQEVGGEKLWLLPQTPWEAGETLKSTAQRALFLPHHDAQYIQSIHVCYILCVYGCNMCGMQVWRRRSWAAPPVVSISTACPGQARATEGVTGVKVFFFKAVLRGRLPPPEPSSLWVRKSELKDYLKPSYLDKVTPFLLAL
ncbi:hypothetical protein CRUP_017443, partial [Coryphaenoides rupestris]